MHLSEMLIRQEHVLNWAVRTFGPVARNRDERAARLVEEAVEVAQAEGVPIEVLDRILRRVYSRPVGEVAAEIGGVAITLDALAENIGVNVQTEADRELRRVLALPADHFQRKHADKVAAEEAGAAMLAAAITKDQAEWEKDLQRHAERAGQDIVTALKADARAEVTTLKAKIEKLRGGMLDAIKYPTIDGPKISRSTYSSGPGEIKPGAMAEWLNKLLSEANLEGWTEEELHEATCHC